MASFAGEKRAIDKRVGFFVATMLKISSFLVYL